MFKQVLRTAHSHGRNRSSRLAKGNSPVSVKVPFFVRRRRGAFTVLSALTMAGALSFVALTVDLGIIALNKTRMQNAVDAASLAAAQELAFKLEEVSNQLSGSADVSAYISSASTAAAASARNVAAKVGEMNDVYIDPNADVEFGKRVFNEATGQFSVQWGVGPYNTVKVAARRDNPDENAPDAMLELFFAPIMGHDKVALEANAAAYVDARDIVVVLDYSGSMNDDSELKSIGDLGQPEVEDNIQDIYDALGPPDLGTMTFEPEWLTVIGQPPSSNSQPQIEVTFKDTEIYTESTKDLSNVVLVFSDGSTYKFDDLNQGTTGTFAGEGEHTGKSIIKCWVKCGENHSGDGSGYGEPFEDSVENVKIAFNLNSVSYPYPVGSWDDFINYVRTDDDVSNAGYYKKYGGLDFVNYLLETKPQFNQTPDLWKTEHYPFHAMKEGVTLYTQFLQELDFSDELGLVTYATTAQVESVLNDPGIEAYVDLGGDLITGDFAAIDTIQRHKQASHYNGSTALGAGIQEATNLLQSHGRSNTAQTILVMTDGMANQSPSGWTPPEGTNWADLTDYDGDGEADYVPDTIHSQYAFWQAKAAADAGIIVNTMSIGNSADNGLMQAIAEISGGVWQAVPGGTTEELNTQMLAAFTKIASYVPPPRLLPDGE